MKLNINLKKISLKRNGHLFGYGNGPDADWRIIFIVLAIFMIAVIASGLYIFLEINRGELFSPKEEAAATPTRLNTALLDKTISYYQYKATELEKIKASKESIKDPSI